MYEVLWKDRIVLIKKFVDLDKDNYIFNFTYIKNKLL